MSFTKVEYKDQETIITAENMNDIQDTILALEDGLFTMEDDRSGEIITITDASNRGFRSLNIFGKTIQAGTPTPDAPVDLVSVGDSGSTNITVAGKNNAKVVLTESTTTKHVSLVKIEPIKLYKGISYVVSFDTENTGVSCYINPRSFTYKTFTMDGTRKTFVFTYTEDKTMDVEADGSSILVSREADTSSVASGLIGNVQIEIADSATDYEPYKGQNLAVSTPNGLPGIPITSGGNYTDANGQQWVCDEIDFARGVYVRRIGKDIIDGSNAVVKKNGTNADYYLYYYEPKEAHDGFGCCTHFMHITGYPQLASQYGCFNITRDAKAAFFCGYGIVTGDNATLTNASEFNGWLRDRYEAGTPVVLLYALATPIETPLTENELVAYAALRTYKDHTTVFNDASAYMELEYVMDAKKYIDGLVIGGGGTSARLTNVTLSASKWTGADSLYSQVVTIPGITKYSKVDLLPSVEQLAIFHNKDVTFVTENEDGVVTVYAIGDKPLLDYTMQAQITEVAV